ncbi:MAG: hypothetical protein GX596_07685 [Propionibacterium sp.]|nr:hypothetical protein [Propionibacterium sp.]
MSDVTKHFIIVFDRAEGRQIAFEEWHSVEEATERYRDLEQANLDSPKEARDIVLVGSDSAESVKVTHASYFAEEHPDATNIKRYLDDFAESHGAMGINQRRIRSPRRAHVQPHLA